MADDAVALIRRVFEQAVARGGGGESLDALSPEAMDAVFESFDPAVEFHEDPYFPEAGVYRGLDAVRRYLTGFTESFDEVRFEAEDFIDLGSGRVLALFTLTMRGKGSGATIESRPGWLYEFRDGRVVRIDAWIDRDTALKAAGVTKR